MNDKVSQSSNAQPKDLHLQEDLVPLGAKNGLANTEPPVPPVQEEIAFFEEKKPSGPVPALADKSPKQPAVPPKNPPPPDPSSALKRTRLWKWGLFMALFLFLGVISGVVPVEKVPGLRNLAYAMGLDKDDTEHMSFLQALLAWTDQTVGLPGNWADELVAKRGGKTSGSDEKEDGLFRGLNNFDRASGQTSLIDMKALNALQSKRGQTPDKVRSAVQVPPGREEADVGPAVLRNGDVNVRTEANRKQGEVFFGNEPTAINRDAKDGYDSVKTLAKIKNPHIAGGKPIDWLLTTTQQAMRTNSPVGGLNRQLRGIHVSWGQGIASLGEKKEHRDLYYAWITSRMGDRTPNILLKKRLVDVGFSGAELPSTASTVVTGGVEIDAASFQEDQEAWKEYLEFERKCKEAFNTAGQRISNRIEEVNKLFNSKEAWDFPANCYEALNTSVSYANSNFRSSVGKIQSYCAQINADYKILENQCYVQVNRAPKVCDAAIIDKYGNDWTSFSGSWCTSKFNEAFEKWRMRPGNEGATQAQYKSTVWLTEGKKYTQRQYVLSTYPKPNSTDNYSGDVTMRNVVLDQQGGSSTYFPTEGDVTQTIINQLAENKTL